MPDFDLAHLCALIADVNKKQASFPFSLPDEEGADITFIPSKSRIYWPGRIGSPQFVYEMEKCGVKETHKLRKNTQNYFRIVRKDGKILRIDIYCNGQPEAILLTHYEGNKRYAFPFSGQGTYCSSYAQVVTYQDGIISEDYMVEKERIVHRSYRKAGDKNVEFREILYVPNGCYPINGIRIGYFTAGEKITCTETFVWTWFRDSEKRGLDQQISALPDFTFQT